MQYITLTTITQLVDVVLSHAIHVSVQLSANLRGVPKRVAHFLENLLSALSRDMTFISPCLLHLLGAFSRLTIETECGVCQPHEFTPAGIDCRFIGVLLIIRESHVIPPGPSLA